MGGTGGQSAVGAAASARGGGTHQVVAEQELLLAGALPCLDDLA